MIAVKETADVNIWRVVEYYIPAIERALEENLPLAPAEVGTEFNDAVRYLIFPGGKRLRPFLTILGAELFGGKAADVMHAAAAVEYIHTSSIIFDDLPSMDNSPHRRGRLSLHEKYGEGLSALVAIGLLNHSYRLVTIDGHGDAQRSLAAVLEIVDCVGPAGMVGGQSIDLMVFSKAECRKCAVRTERDLQNLKTSALIRLSLNLGAILAGAKDDERVHLSAFADCLGHAYQISDDIIDTEQDAPLVAINGSPEDDSDPINSLRSDLMEAAMRSKSILHGHFPPSQARNCLLQLVAYVADRKD